MQQIIRTLRRWLRPASRVSSKPLSSDAVQKLVRELEHTRDAEYTCDEVLRLLDQFAEATLRGEDAARLMPLVQHHLDNCVDCREEFEALMRILRASPAASY
jgi:hypothetical protein